jgi:hypothetical protein
MRSIGEILENISDEEKERDIEDLDSFAREIGFGYAPENWGEPWIIPWYVLVKASKYQFGGDLSEEFVKETIEKFEDIDDEHEELHYFLIEFLGKVAEASVEYIGDAPDGYDDDFDINYEKYKKEIYATISPTE